jgi:hypothetical protein
MELAPQASHPAQSATRLQYSTAIRKLEYECSKHYYELSPAFAIKAKLWSLLTKVKILTLDHIHYYSISFHLQ